MEIRINVIQLMDAASRKKAHNIYTPNHQQNINKTKKIVIQAMVVC